VSNTFSPSGNRHFSDPAGFSDRGRYVVQVSVFKSRRQAAQLMEKLAENGFPAYVAEVESPTPDLPGTYHRVRVGKFKTISDAKAFGDNTLATMGYGYWVDNKSNDNVGAGVDYGSGSTYEAPPAYEAPAYNPPAPAYEEPAPTYEPTPTPSAPPAYEEPAPTPTPSSEPIPSYEAESAPPPTSQPSPTSDDGWGNPVPEGDPWGEPVPAETTESFPDTSGLDGW
jgi:hypothetical protein